MIQLPFDIPQSLVSYAEQFEKNPEKATHRLKKQLAKRGPDAVGYCLLAWLLYLQDDHEQAVKEALKARIFAPGSSFLQHFHYYLSHPELFEAWTPDSPVPPVPSREIHKGPIPDLDSLIEKLSKAEAHRIRPKEMPSDSQKSTSTEVSIETDGIVSETLAKIHEDQGKIDTAIHSYRQLKKIKPEKCDYYDQQISRLKKLKNNSGKK